MCGVYYIYCLIRGWSLLYVSPYECVIGGYNDTEKIAFSGRQNDEKMLNESPIFPNQDFHEP